MQRKLVTLLTIAGSDCTGGAGIQADIRAAAACGVYAMSVVTAVTAQNSKGVANILPISYHDLKAQLQAISEEIIPDAVKIGMIGSIDNCEVIADFLETLPSSIPIVVDPVLASSAGGDLSSNKPKLADLMISRLFPLSDVVTPNLKEAEYFIGKTFDCVNHGSTQGIAAELLKIFRSKAVILKGGHLSGNILVDTLVSKEDPDTPRKYRSKRIVCKNLHGTGCTYASILASELAKNNTIGNAFFKASSMINDIISKSIDYDFGASNYGPLNVLDYKTKIKAL